MKPLSRNPVNKSSSARSFRSNTYKTAAANVRGMPMRGGFRF
jgi:hypothetical protein